MASSDLEGWLPGAWHTVGAAANVLFTRGEKAGDPDLVTIARRLDEATREIERLLRVLRDCRHVLLLDFPDGPPDDATREWAGMYTGYTYGRDDYPAYGAYLKAKYSDWQVQRWAMVGPIVDRIQEALGDLSRE